MFDAKYEPLYIEERTLKEIDNFWDYFFREEEKIILALYNKDRQYLSYFEDQLKKVFFRYQKGLRFVFEKKDNVIHFTIFYGRNSYLLTVGNELFNYNFKKLKKEWSFELKQ